ncbi:sensor histidine kinase [Fulvivirga sp. 29W222]|uniref:Oxygen sensor histidine kinase NreB n=1 Tax=Fulvivirga marina TaxID=2494733 RepID=A0A937FZZ8_9BACT|nr:sensor histidine kinase [Fulvivirga marina]MBL6447606.1 sensor histidine kinase [Fulvivirga marina]
MFKTQEEIFFAVVLSTLLLLFFGVIVIIAVMKYQNRRRKHLLEVNTLKVLYEKELLKTQLEVREQTLTNMSQEIHDNIGQVLALAKLNLSKILLGENVSNADRLEATKSLVSKAIQDLRNLSKTMNSHYINTYNLSELIRNDIDQINKTSEFKTAYQIDGKEVRIDPHQQLIIYRIIQESLNNIIKHSHGNEIHIFLYFEQEFLQVTIRDNGIGFDLESQSKATNFGHGTGLINMQNRAKLIGAHFEIKSNPNKGTSVELKLPLV